LLFIQEKEKATISIVLSRLSERAGQLSIQYPYAQFAEPMWITLEKALLEICDLEARQTYF
jgi:hypothetical protein